MSDTRKWSVRGVDREAVELLLAVQRDCGQTLGALLSDAIHTWYEQLPIIGLDIEDDQDEEMAILSSLVAPLAQQI
jgi:hypothetical protein